MFDLLNNIESLTKEEINNKNIILYLQEKIVSKKILILSLLILGKTYRQLNSFTQETYIGMINENYYFYLELEDNKCKTVIVNKNIEIIFDLFYNRELFKDEKEHNIKEIKSMLLYKKLHYKLTNNLKQKLQKI